MKTTGGKLLYYRRKRNLKQEELARILNINVCTIKRWENNHQLPSIELGKRVADILGIPFEEICGDYNNFLNSDFRSILINYRKNNNLTLKEMGKILGVDKTTVADWEKGISKPQKTKYKSIQNFIKKIHTFIFL